MKVYPACFVSGGVKKVQKRESVFVTGDKNIFIFAPGMKKKRFYVLENIFGKKDINKMFANSSGGERR